MEYLKSIKFQVANEKHLVDEKVNSEIIDIKRTFAEEIE